MKRVSGNPAAREAATCAATLALFFSKAMLVCLLEPALRLLIRSSR